MRVLIINTSERIGGAAIAASRLMEALKSSGIKARCWYATNKLKQVTVVALKKSWRKSAIRMGAYHYMESQSL